MVGSRTNVTRDKTVGQDVDSYNLGCCRFLVCLVSHCTSTHTRITRRRAIQDIFVWVLLLGATRGFGLLEVGARPGRVPCVPRLSRGCDARHLWLWVA